MGQALSSTYPLDVAGPFCLGLYKRGRGSAVNAAAKLNVLVAFIALLFLSAIVYATF